MIMKKNIYIALSILLTLPVSAKIEVLDRVAIIVGEGVVLESQVNNMLENIKTRYQEQGAPMPPQEVMLEQVQELEQEQLRVRKTSTVRLGGAPNLGFTARSSICQESGLAFSCR